MSTEGAWLPVGCPSRLGGLLSCPGKDGTDGIWGMPS